MDFGSKNVYYTKMSILLILRKKYVTNHFILKNWTAGVANFIFEMQSIIGLQQKEQIKKGGHGVQFFSGKPFSVQCWVNFEHFPLYSYITGIFDTPSSAHYKKNSTSRIPTIVVLIHQKTPQIRINELKTNVHRAIFFSSGVASHLKFYLMSHEII